MSYILSNPVYIVVFAVVFCAMYFWAAHKARTTQKPHYRMMKGILAAVVLLLAMAVIANGRAG